MKILFISHHTTRTGAPILLLNLIRLLRTVGFDTTILLKYGGALVEEFASLAPTTIAHQIKRDLISRIKASITKTNHFDLRNIELSQFDLIIFNTVTNGDILPLIREHIPIILIMSVTIKTFQKCILTLQY